MSKSVPILPTTALPISPAGATRASQTTASSVISVENPGDSKANVSICDIVDRLTNLEDFVHFGGISLDSTGANRGKNVLSPLPFAIANPSPLGLFGFAIVSFLAGMLKIFPDTTLRQDGLLSAVAIFIGGIAQVLAGIIKVLKNETHSATVFCLFGFHWICQGCIVGILSLRELTFLTVYSKESSAVYFTLLTVTTLILWIPTFRMNLVLCCTLGVVIGVFLLDAIAAAGWRGVEIASGAASCVAASMAFYMGLLDLVNETWKRPVLPLFPHKDHKEDYDDSIERPYVPRRSFHKSSMSSAHL